MSGTDAVRLGMQPLAGSLNARVGMALFAASIILNYARFSVVDSHEVALDWQAAVRFGLCGLCGCYALWNFPYALRAVTRFPMAWLLVFIGWAWLILPAAIAPAYATAACAALTLAALFTASLVERVSGEAIARTIVSTIFVFAVGCWIAQFSLPELGQADYFFPGQDDASWRLGGLTHPNGLGAHCALALGMLCVGRTTWRWHGWTVACLALFFLVTLLASGSRTSLLMVVAALSVPAVRKAPAWCLAAVALLATLALAGEACGMEWKRWVAAISREGDVEEIVTLTGRTDLWRTALEHIEQSPVWGWGYGCSRYIFLELASFPATHPHNMFLDVTVETGVTGGLVEAAMFVALARRMFSHPSPFADTVLAVTVVMGLFEVPVFNPVPEAFTMCWMLALGWHREDFATSSSDARLTADFRLPDRGEPA